MVLIKNLKQTPDLGRVLFSISGKGSAKALSDNPSLDRSGTLVNAIVGLDQSNVHAIHSSPDTGFILNKWFTINTEIRRAGREEI